MTLDCEKKRPGPFLFVPVVLLWLCSSVGVLALTVDDLDPEREWRVKQITIAGNKAFTESELLAKLATQQRPRYLPWRARPIFDPVAFATDLERLHRFYEAHGYYQSRVTYDLQVDDQASLVTVQIHVEENLPVTVAEVKVETSDARADEGTSLRTLPREELPLQVGEVFSEEEYQEGEQVLRDFFLQRGHPWVQTQRKATVDLSRDQVRVWYAVQPGPQAVFGSTRVEGTARVNPQLILRELTYQPGERFSVEKIATSQEKILNLGLFSAVQVMPERDAKDQPVVPMRVRVEEKPPRSFKVGVSYGTEDEFGGQIEWQHRNWLGGGRQLSLLLRYSSITSALGATLIQPHFFSPRTRGILSLRHEQEDEETFLLNATRFRPRLEHNFSRTLSGFVGYRLEFAQLNDVAPATIRALGGIKRDGILSGPSVGLVWNTTEDPFDPQKGTAFSLFADQAGELWGGDFRFYKITLEGKKYQPLGWKTVLAGRVKIGIADSFGTLQNIPLFERFYAGGEKSVRGYGRRRLGPISTSDDPLGGLSLIEGSVELRRPLWQELSGALFLDFGQISTRSLDLPLDDLKFAAGLGVSYTTPLGPLRLDLGFPFDPPRGDQSWQVHFSIGQFF